MKGKNDDRIGKRYRNCKKMQERQENTGYQILDTGYWILDTGYRIPDMPVSATSIRHPASNNFSPVI
jgi:hypothetical protein